MAKVEQGTAHVLTENHGYPCLEVCVADSSGLAGALAGNADRIEVCSALELGGLTPSIGFVESVLASSIPAMFLVRPRAGGFVYSADDMGVVLRDIAKIRARGAKGVVVGAAMEDGRLDIESLKRMREVAGDLDMCLHRVFDLTPDPFEALDQVVELGFVRILTSGQRTKLTDGLDVLKKLNAYGQNRISIMPGGGVQLENIKALVQNVGVHEIHSSCSSDQADVPPVLKQFGFASPIKQKTISVQKVIAMRDALYAHHMARVEAKTPHSDACEHKLKTVVFHKGAA